MKTAGFYEIIYHQGPYEETLESISFVDMYCIFNVNSTIKSRPIYGVALYC